MRQQNRARTNRIPRCFFRSLRATPISRRSRAYFSKMNLSLRLHLGRTMSAASRMRRRSQTNWRSIPAASSFNCFTAWPARSNGRWSKWAIAFANTVRLANSCPVWLISCAACLRTRRTKDFCGQNLPKMCQRKICCAIPESSSNRMEPIDQVHRSWLKRKIVTAKMALHFKRHAAIFSKTHHL